MKQELRKELHAAIKRGEAGKALAERAAQHDARCLELEVRDDANKHK